MHGAAASGSALGLGAQRHLGSEVSAQPPSLGGRLKGGARRVRSLRTPVCWPAGLGAALAFRSGMPRGRRERSGSAGGNSGGRGGDAGEWLRGGGVSGSGRRSGGRGKAGPREGSDTCQSTPLRGARAAGPGAPASCLRRSYVNEGA